MGFIYTLIYIAILFFCCVYVWRLMLSLPQDMSHIKMLQETASKPDIFYGELVSLSGSWLLALIMFVIIIGPALWHILFGWLQIGTIFTMFFEAIL